MKRLLAHWWAKLKCLVVGHNWFETDIFHIDYKDNGYDVLEYYVEYCQRCGKRKGKGRIRDLDDRGNHA